MVDTTNLIAPDAVLGIACAEDGARSKKQMEA